MASANRIQGFWSAFDRQVAAALETGAGKALSADPRTKWRAIATGGGCTAWEMRSLEDGAAFWICTQAQGIEGAADETYLVGLHPDLEWLDHWFGEAQGIEAAIALAHAAHAARCFALFFRADAKLTLAEFAATRRAVRDLGPVDESEAGNPGLIYAGNAFIRGDESGYGLIIGNSEYTAKDASELEPILYGFAYTEGYLDKPAQPES